MPHGHKFWFVVIAISRTVVPFVVGMVVASVAFRTLGGFVTIFFLTWAIVRLFEEALCTNVPFFPTYFKRGLGGKHCLAYGAI